MMRKVGMGLVLAGVLAPAFVAQRAEAQDLSSCGDIYIEANAQCEVVPPGVQCEAQCEPINVQAACSARLAVECNGQCNADIDVGCEVEQCGIACEAECNIDPGAFDCSAQCQVDCGGRCDAYCAANGGGAECKASCEGSCSASCDTDCNVVPPSADCKARCDASCEASCHAEANFDCQIDCQAEGYAGCEVEVTGGCKAECETQEGALFCDGQYIDHRGKLEECVDALRALLDIEVEGYAEGEAECVNGTCTASGEAGASCSVQPGGTSSLSGTLLALGMPALFVVLRRRRRHD